jgi:protein phosphatase
MIEYGYASHAGMHRHHNEDTYCADAAQAVFVVVDGMGGPGHGEAAAALARDCLHQDLRAGAALVAALQAAGQSIRSHAEAHPGRAPIGASAAVLRLREGGFELAWIGGCRVLVAPAALYIDAPTESPMVDAAALPAADDMTPCRASATQALGLTAAESLTICTRSGRCASGQSVLLCTDGLGEHVDPRRIAAVLARDDLSPQECVDHLLLAALDNGARDNLTALLVRIR